MYILYCLFLVVTILLELTKLEVFQFFWNKSKKTIANLTAVFFRYTQKPFQSLQCIFILLLTLCSASHVLAQVTFTNATSILPNRGFLGLGSKGVADVNGDGLDDIVRTKFPSGNLFVTYQLENGLFRSDSLGSLPAMPLSTTIGDVNNDKRNDIVTGGNYDGITIHYNQGSSFQSKNFNSPLILMQSANLVDINTDGWLDYLGLHDIGLDQIWKNDKAGNLLPVTNWIDFRTVPVTDNSGNYGSVWSDIDNDGDLDLYIAKCAIELYGSAYLNDPRRINQLFINNTYSKVNGQIVKNTNDFTTNPTGWFTEDAGSRNVKINTQSWTADFADIDNDGDQDLFVTNHEGPSLLMENDGTGHFKDITTQSTITGIVLPLQSIMKDFDNDGYVDILVCGGTELQLWKNNGDKTFTKQNFPFGKAVTQSFAVGDMNHDGFLDVYTSFDVNTGVPDSLWMNNGNANHFMAITLQGVQSNYNGVGAKITVYRANGAIQVQEVRAGEGYGVSHSFTHIFGLGNNSQVSKITVNWPTGKQDTYSNPTADKFLYLQEGGCMLTTINGICPTNGSCGCTTITVMKQ